MELEFNLNNYIRFKPTEKGLHHIVERHNSIMPPSMHTCFKLEKEKLNNEGYLKWQTHSFIDMFGSLGMGLDNYIEVTVYFTQS